MPINLSPNTQALCEAIERGASNPDIDGVDVTVLTPFEAGVEDVLAADGVILSTTENLGYMSGAMKDFFDRSYYGVLEEKQAMPYGLLVRAGLDGTGTIRAINSIATQGLRWKPICDPVWCKGEWEENFLVRAEELGTLMAAGLEAGVF
ncbi:flavodoxin family protein [Curvivirga aplysinae]|uniref:flavodoxin family protein n=1 Tax=Curvivirga aplysinae TaxID=2529852 RepID=UPI001C3FF517|nr:NAD(P)H-dependent oxidoreductase [Curvivirga aplysinae]